MLARVLTDGETSARVRFEVKLKLCSTWPETFNKLKVVKNQWNLPPVMSKVKVRLENTGAVFISNNGCLHQ